jgi:hypothetical protein
VRRALGDLFSSLLGLGAILLASPFFLWWWIHGSYERYVWIISGPYPYDNLGGGPFGVMVYAGLFAAGFVLTSIAPTLRSVLRNPS